MSASNENAQCVASETSHANFPVNEATQESETAILKPLEHIRLTPTIAEERGEDIESNFWAAYERVSNEYDNEFFKRENDDMNVILVFAGFFLIVNCAFIVGTHPNPSTESSSPTIWLYASLSSSLLAALGAVMGKQWLNSYMADRGEGSLRERGLHRQRKLDGLKRWRFQPVLRSFFVLLQISILLFGLSLSANAWTQSRTISRGQFIHDTFTDGRLAYGQLKNPMPQGVDATLSD